MSSTARTLLGSDQNSQITNQHEPFVVSWPIRQPYLCLHEQMANAYRMLQAHNRQNKHHVVGPVQFGKHTGPYHASSWRQPQADPLSPHVELRAGGWPGTVCVLKNRLHKVSCSTKDDAWLTIDGQTA